MLPGLGIARSGKVRENGNRGLNCQEAGHSTLLSIMSEYGFQKTAQLARHLKALFASELNGTGPQVRISDWALDCTMDLLEDCSFAAKILAQASRHQSR
jgi:hypothetical protein